MFTPLVLLSSHQSGLGQVVEALLLCNISDINFSNKHIPLVRGTLIKTYNLSLSCGNNVLPPVKMMLPQRPSIKPLDNKTTSMATEAKKCIHLEPPLIQNWLQIRMA